MDSGDEWLGREKKGKERIQQNAPAEIIPTPVCEGKRRQRFFCTLCISQDRAVVDVEEDETSPPIHPVSPIVPTSKQEVCPIFFRHLLLSSLTTER